MGELIRKPSMRGVSNGPIQDESARKIWPLLELLEKTRWVLDCSICILETKTDTGNKVSGNMRSHRIFCETRITAKRRTEMPDPRNSTKIFGDPWFMKDH